MDNRPSAQGRLGRADRGPVLRACVLPPYCRPHPIEEAFSKIKGLCAKQARTREAPIEAGFGALGDYGPRPGASSTFGYRSPGPPYATL